MKLILILFAVLLNSQAYASGAAYLMIQNGLAKSNDQAQFSTAVKADGYLVVHSFYFDGPTIMICPGQEGGNVVVHEGACALKETKRLPFFSFSWSGVEHSFKSLGAGITMQQYLDKRFGVGAVNFAGISPRTGRLEESLFVYYTINKSK